MAGNYDRDPIKSEPIDNGLIRYTMPDGTPIIVGLEPVHLMRYQSYFFDARPGDYFEVDVSILGHAVGGTDQDSFEAWNHSRTQFRYYRYDKVISLINKKTGNVLTGDVLKSRLLAKVGLPSSSPSAYCP